MSASERKQTTLPCGFLLSSSWAALRKSWLGFNICLSKGDRAGMSIYAFRIRKLQRQMGIDPTDFEPDLLSKEDADFIDQKYSAGDDELPQRATVEEREVDYDSMFDRSELRENLDGPTRQTPAPRKAIFAKYNSRLDKSCPQENSVRVTKQVSNPRSSCPVGDFDAQPVTYPDMINKKVSYSADKTCFIADGEPPYYNTESKNAVSSYDSTINSQGKYSTNERTWPPDTPWSSRQKVEPNSQNDSDWQGYPYDPDAHTHKAEKKNRHKSKRRRKSVFYQQQIDDDATIKRDRFCPYFGQD